MYEKKKARNSESQLLAQNSWIAQIEIGRTRGRTNEKEKKIDKQIKAYIVNGMRCKQTELFGVLLPQEQTNSEKKESSWNRVNHLMDFSHTYDRWTKQRKKRSLCKQSYSEYSFRISFLTFMSSYSEKNRCFKLAQKQWIIVFANENVIFFF